MNKTKTLYEFKHNFYSKLYAAMEKKNKTYKDLSTDLGKNPGYISRVTVLYGNGIRSFRDLIVVKNRMKIPAERVV